MINEFLRKSPNYFVSDDKYIFDDNTNNYELTSLQQKEDDYESDENLESYSEDQKTKSKRMSRRSSTASNVTDVNQKPDNFDQMKDETTKKSVSKSKKRSSRSLSTGKNLATCRIHQY